MIRKIISGGQTGVDRAALDFFIKLNIPCAGWCPRDRMAEDGPIPKKYPLKETKQSLPIFRTKKNIEIADGTLILFKDQLDEGTLQTKLYAEARGFPLFIHDLSKDFWQEDFSQWMLTYKIAVLNIAGPRESNSPGIYKHTVIFLEKLRELF